VAAIALREDVDLEGYPITIMAEACVSDPETLFKLALKFADEFSVDRYYGDTQEAGMMQILNIFNRDRSKRSLKPFRLSDPPPIEGESNPMMFYFQLIKKHLRPGKKSLHFGPDGIYPGYLLNLSSEEAGKAKPADHSCIAALGHVLGILTHRTNRKLPRATRYETEFDPLAPNYGAKPWQIDRRTVANDWAPWQNS
jgi:hypothetical protein